MHCPELMVVYAGVWVWMRSLISLEHTPDYSWKITTSQWPKTAAIQQRSEMRVLFTHAQWGLISPEWVEGSIRGRAGTNRLKVHWKDTLILLLALTDIESTGKTLWFYCLICFTISSFNWADNRCTFISLGSLVTQCWFYCLWRIGNKIGHESISLREIKVS